MTDAPERIWVEKSISEIGTHGSTAWPDEDKDCIEYTRADVSDALVAAAREETRAKTLAAVSSMLGDSSILALTTVEEEALLEKTLQKVREEALREADKNLSVYAPTLVDGPEHDVGYYHGYSTAMNRILALIEKDAE